MKPFIAFCKFSKLSLHTDNNLLNFSISYINTVVKEGKEPTSVILKSSTFPFYLQSNSGKFYNKSFAISITMSSLDFPCITEEILG
jgi:hypothetical protein